MTELNFQAMTRKDLLAYMLEHRDDDEAFHSFMDKVNAEPAGEFYPAPQSIDDSQAFSPIVRRISS